MTPPFTPQIPTPAPRPVLPPNFKPTDMIRDPALLTRMICERSLADFVQRAWHVIEPGTPLLWNWHIDVLCAYLEAFFTGKIRRLILNVPPGSLKSVLVSVMGPAWAWAKNPSARIINLTNEIGLATRDSLRMRHVIESDWYRRHWAHKFKLSGDQREKLYFENTKRGFRQGLGITGNITGKRANFLLIDDPLDARRAFSDIQVQSVNDAYDQAVSSRLNDLSKDGICLIQQRLRTNDLTGHLLSKKATDWVHVRIPMEYEGEPGYNPVRDLGPEYVHLIDPRREVGELFFPERFTAEAVAALKEDLGDYGCTPYESPVLMGDLSMKPVGEVNPGDEVVGFDRRERLDGKPGRMRLTKATVLEVFKYDAAPVVKMTLDTGEVIRCTEDHKWFLSRAAHDGHRPMYGPVRLGRKTKLARICPAYLPPLRGEDQRLAGWLSGFFDGEGTISLGRKNVAGDYRDSADIRFYQGAGRNLPLCEKLESALTHFGFEYTYTEDERKDNKTAACYGYRNYRLVGNDVSLYQRFLHIVDPIKWRDRIINGAFGARFIKGREQVMSVEPDGHETVYALKTTTGNYVVWGLASSNSAGQLQQRPSPLAGGVLKKSYWRMWPDDKPLPVILHAFASWDTAFTERDLQSAAYSACTVWGVWLDEQDVSPSSPEGRHKLFLLSSWYGRVDFPDLIARAKKIQHDKLTHATDAHLIERKASGISLIQTLTRRPTLRVLGYDPKRDGGGDKVTRAYRIQPLFQAGMIWAPNRAWALDCIEQVAAFPAGAPPSADVTDTVTQAVSYLDRGWWVHHPDEDQMPYAHGPAEDDEDDFLGRHLNTRKIYG